MAGKNEGRVVMRNLLLRSVYVLAAIAGFATSVNADTLRGMRDVGSTIKTAFISENRPTLAPFAMIQFCKENPGDCEKNSSDINFPEEGIARTLLRQVNAQVNASIRGEYDQVDGKSVDVWQIGAASGDCEDYALTKRRILTQKGFPAAALRIAVAYTPSGEGHAVLIAKTKSGDVVLDNRTNVIKSWQTTNLRWVKIQSGENPLLWYTM